MDLRRGLVREIVNLLINTDKTMQAIADELHFSDQAACDDQILQED